MSPKDQPTDVDEKVLSQSSQQSIHKEDIAQSVQIDQEEPVVQDWSEKEEKKLVRRIDNHVFPMLCIIFGFSLLDRTNISAAYIAGMSEDLELHIGARYSIALLVFFIGYALFEIPSNMVIRRVGARVWLPFLIIVWGSSVLAMGFVHSWVSLTVLRVILGIFEAGLYPGAVFIIASWYKKYEMAARISLFYMAALFASGFGPIFAYVLSLIRVGDGMYRQGWRWIPEKAKFLNERDKHIALARLQENRVKTSSVEGHATVKEVLRMLLDWKLIVFSFQYFTAAATVYALAYFQPIILRQGMGYSYALAQLLSSPPYVFAVIMSLTSAWVSDRLRIRWPIICAQCAIAVVGLIIVLYGRLPGVRYFGLFLAVYGSQANGPQFLAYGQNQTATLNKKGIVAAVMISVGAAGGVTGSTIFRAQDAPQYIPGMWTTISLQIMTGIITFITSMWLKRQNRLADEGKRPALEGVEGFRYAP
ncbi:hypothetical protein PV10_00590 [Exophiala mesophila]|uniref:Major facilitator superfamily (MFS) profile domain-containing protein n=1 Tax=Exophiala mesophila TaxID=212818 RepID=A0A0D1ZS44_EXOME|nr:uncharacterized protein PV10_00590 [Exophiala mesophila]KIV96769.1 hypothetical protein PV10_00590 [Exophiala mesophila]